MKIKPNDPHYSKPLSNRMNEILMECHERELMKMIPLQSAQVQNLSGLMSRGMLRCANFENEDGKKLTGFYITQMGKRYLSQL